MSGRTIDWEVIALGQVMNLAYECKGASVYNLREINSSFASGSLRVMYTGENRNGSYISRDAVEAALPTLYNVPIVCHYIYEDNMIGGHDISVERDENDNLRLRTLTEPCGVVPEHAVFRFENMEDDAGAEHEYLVIDGVILWKRQDVYRHITEDLDGCVKHSMEINVTNGGRTDSGVYDIRGFEFTALCLLEACNPCFQGSQLELYAMAGFKEKMTQMMAELKEALTLVTSSAEDDDTHSHNHSKEGGMALPEKIALLEQYGLTAETADFAFEEMALEKLEAYLAEKYGYKTAENAPEQEPEAEPAQEEQNEEQSEEPEDTADPEPEEEPAAVGEFALAGDIAEELAHALGEEKVERPWGMDSRYWFWDYDADKHEVYCTDCTDWLLYGFAYTMSGDAVAIDFDSKKRMKLVPVEYIDGTNDQFSMTIEAVSQKYSAELETLRAFKLDVEEKALNAKREEVLAGFADLNGIEAFEAVRNNIGQYSPEALEEKCYALRGRYGTTVKFSEQKSQKIPIHKTEQADEPYGGLFVKYNVAKTNN